VVESRRFLSFLGVVQPQDLIAEKQVDVVPALADHVHPHLLHQEPGKLGPVGDPDVHVVEAQDPKVSGRRFHASTDRKVPAEPGMHRLA